MGKPMVKKRVTRKQKLDAITGSGGLLHEIATRCGVHRATVRAWRDADSEIAQAIEAERESVTDTAEKNLVDAIRGGDIHASKYWLSTIGRARGFSQRTEVEAKVTTNDTGRVTIYLPDNGREPVNESDPAGCVRITRGEN
jgi:hypothetical protein